ncbi:BglII/BstYI family type II restriction endonuclease [Bradyrhizobium neotropicale]|uniref:BglII/BstYI family type II restriction endonuclease n=1 Tax=Bradyrhizobium neotropicale TaxID=1497615 RepID=UPI001AD68545|nr:BglII/BstYI family type II restriction endonuclease [Bradyrhizobium neotropicale]MBO4227399.1 restriction endonuclease [Bradyrhizobium neotropicale]
MYSHQGASEALPAGERAEIESAIASCHVAIRRGAATEIRDRITSHLGRKGWPGEFQVEPPSKITIASLKNGVGLCVQTGGNMSRMYADLLKLQKLYMEDRVKSGAFVLPTAQAARDIGDNIANASRLQTELTIFRKVIHMPIALFSFE